MQCSFDMTISRLLEQTLMRFKKHGPHGSSGRTLYDANIGLGGLNGVPTVVFDICLPSVISMRPQQCSQKTDVGLCRPKCPIPTTSLAILRLHDVGV